MIGFVSAMLLAGQAEVPAVRAEARQNLASYLTDQDYPAQALARRASGIVHFELEISPEGRATACRVTRSSGEASLDERTCRIMLRRARFRPARDHSGRPVRDTISSRLGWFPQ